MSQQRGRSAAPALRRLVMGIDFEAPSLAAAEWLRQHFAPAAETLLVHALDVPYPGAFLESPFPSHLQLLEDARIEAEGRLAEISETLRASRWEVREGRSEEALCQAALEDEADLVVVGEHGQGRPRWNLLGSTAERLLHTSPVPVLLARGLPRGKPQHLLVPVDDSGLAASALCWAHFLARHFGTRVTVLHVLSRSFPGHIQRVSSREVALGLEREVERQTWNWLEGQAKEAGLEGADVSIVLRRGSPSHEILSEAARCQADLVVMGSRGSGAAGRWLLGSVAASVVRGGSLPVLVAMERNPAAQSEPYSQESEGTEG